MNKIISFDKEAKEKLQYGIDKVNKAVSITMGPWGRNVLIEKEYGQVSSTKDGVTVAKSITLEDPIENMAATVIKQAATKTVDQAGDGTTTSTVLCHSIASGALSSTYYPSTNVTEIKKGIEEAVKEIVDGLKKLSKDISDEEQIKQVATLSANGDEEIGNLVSTAIDKVGRDGVVTVEKSRSGETSLEIVEGIQFDRGYKSPYFVTDNNTMSCVLNQPYILLYNGKIGAVKDLLPILDRIAQGDKSLLIIADDIDGEALATLVMNKARGVLRVCAVKAPDFGDRRVQILEDIAILTGGKVLSNDKGMTLSKFDMSWLGEARIATINKDLTTIVDGKGETDEIEERILSLKTLIDNATSPYEIEKLQERLGKMIGGVAIINVGGFNEIEMDEKKDRIDDALQATKAALEEGIVPGAGVALLEIVNPLMDKLNKEKLDDFERGKLIVYESCIIPIKTILSNAGKDPQRYLYKLWNNSISFEKVLVPDVKNDSFIDPYESGIIDPTKVVRCALQNAASAAITLLMTECVIHNKPNPEKKENSGGMAEFGF